MRQTDADRGAGSGEGVEGNRRRRVNPIVRQLLELGPPLAFFLAYLRLRDQTFSLWGTDYSGFIVATVLFVPLLLAAMALLWWLTGELSRLQLFTAVMVVLFGGLTAFFNDERFFKMKTSIVYAVFAGLLGLGLARGRSGLAWLLGDALPLTEEGWMILTRRLTLVFIGLAVGNEILWRNASTDVWVKVETFGFPLILFVFLWAQMMALGAHMRPEAAAAQEPAGGHGKHEDRGERRDEG